MVEIKEPVKTNLIITCSSHFCCSYTSHSGIIPLITLYFNFCWIELFLRTNQHLSYKFTWLQSLVSYYKSQFSGYFVDSIWQGTNDLKIRSLSLSLYLFLLNTIQNVPVIFGSLFSQVRHEIDHYSQFWLLSSLSILIFIHNGI